MNTVVVFDLDDTLYPEKDFVLSGFKAISDWLQNVKNISGFFELSQHNFLKGRRRKIINLVLDQMGVSYSEEDVKLLLQIYRKHKPNIALFEDAAWALDYFKKDQLALTTDGYYETQMNKVTSLNIKDKFKCILYTDKFGRNCWKPNPFSYEKVMQVFQCSGGMCHYIADNPTKDFIAAKRLGWKTIQIYRRGSEYGDIFVDELHQADKVIFNLYQLKQLLL